MPFDKLIFYFLIIVPSAIIHEFAHGWAAESLGDPTARYAGRLTLDPRAHIDLFGTILLPILLSFSGFMFAYAKPVPYNPHNLRNQKWGPSLVGLAGPAANFLLAAAFALVLRFFPVSGFSEFLVTIVYANVMLMVFNLVPIPPLDGSKILYSILPASAWRVREFLDRFGFVLLLFFVFFLFQLLHPIIQTIFNLLIGGTV